tara:strand:- start:8272 stop:8835 length:564 start_codon:yes stop_codon:yes gene_type:complete
MKRLVISFLVKLINSLSDDFDKNTLQKYKRINPFLENIFDWKKRGKLWSGNNNVTIYNSTTLVGDVKIGENTWIGPFCSIDGTGGIKIGSNCSISSSVHIQSHDTVRWALSGGAHDYEYDQVKIGNNCFIGVGAVILKGVKIGDSSVIGAGAIVNKSFPSNSIISGVPARKIGSVVFRNNKIDFDFD